MPFSEKIKLEVKQKAAFQCCRCRSIGIDVHHILPEKDGGPNDIDNAAPLCQNCHNQLGDNPSKRKEITQMRDWWYRTCEQMYCSKNIDLDLFNQIDAKLDDIRKNQPGLPELKVMLKNLSNEIIENMTAKTAIVTASGIVNASTASVSAATLGDKVHANFQCNNCGTAIGLLIGSNVCPNCESPVN